MGCLGILRVPAVTPSPWTLLPLLKNPTLKTCPLMSTGVVLGFSYRQIEAIGICLGAFDTWAQFFFSRLTGETHTWPWRRFPERFWLQQFVSGVGNHFWKQLIRSWAKYYKSITWMFRSFWRAGIPLQNPPIWGNYSAKKSRCKWPSIWWFFFPTQEVTTRQLENLESWHSKEWVELQK